MNREAAWPHREIKTWPLLRNDERVSEDGYIHHCKLDDEAWPCPSQRYLDQLRAERIDVERLARAMWNREKAFLPVSAVHPWEVLPAAERALVVAEAAPLAAEYDRLASQTREEVPFSASACERTMRAMTNGEQGCSNPTEHASQTREEGT